MKLLTKNTDYAIRALLVLGQNHEEFLSIQKIADIQRIPYEYLRKIAQQLIKYGFVESKSGGQGGVRLMMSPKKIKVSDIIQLFQGEFQLSECMFRRKFCHNRATCVLRKKIINIEAMVTKEFETITIASLLHDLKEEK